LTEERVERRLAAILAADVVGYSRLVSRDEADALARLGTLRRDIIEPYIAGHSGRIFKIMGDGFLAEFASAVQAVSCALAIQTETEAVASGCDDAQKMRLRIGIHAATSW
jgi:adenylate cyclase